MPINAFGGGPGSGKTYGVMEHVILPAVAKGRFIITNIEGLKHDDIYQYVHDNAPKGKIICIGHIRSCTRSAPEEDGFFPGEEALDVAQPVPAPDRPNVNGGDLVVIDEATRYWQVGTRVKPRHYYFFREHRHFSNEMGDTCDLVVIDPDLTELAKSLRGKIEMSSVTRKLKEIGVNRYMVDVYSKCRLRKPIQNLGPYAYKPEIYNLYKSYSHEKAKEQQVDGRQNMLKGAFWRYGMPLALVACVAGFYTSWSYLSSMGQKKKTAESAEQTDPKTTPAAEPSQPLADVKLKSSAPEISDKWRAAGYVQKGGDVYFYLDDGEMRRVLDNPLTFKLSRRSYELKVGEQWVTEYSGPSSRSSSPLPR